MSEICSILAPLETSHSGVAVKGVLKLPPHTRNESQGREGVSECVRARHACVPAVFVWFYPPSARSKARWFSRSSPSAAKDLAGTAVVLSTMASESIVNLAVPCC